MLTIEGYWGDFCLAFQDALGVRQRSNRTEGSAGLCGGGGSEATSGATGYSKVFQIKMDL